MIKLNLKNQKFQNTFITFAGTLLFLVQSYRSVDQYQILSTEREQKSIQKFLETIFKMTSKVKSYEFSNFRLTNEFELSYALK